MIIIGWIGTLTVLSTYFWSARTGDIKLFNYGNVIGSILLFFANISLGAPMPTIALGVAFGLIGLYGILKGN